MRVLLIQNSELEGFGYYLEHLLQRDCECAVLRAYDGEDFPPIAEWDLALVGGTPVAAAEFPDHLRYANEYRYLREALAQDKPVFGICCGAQVLAAILGGTLGRLSEMEIGSLDLCLTRAGKRDPVFAGFPNRFPVFHWHADAFGIPAGGECLVSGPDETVAPFQAFRAGSVVGVLFHLEVGAGFAARWVSAYRDELQPGGKSPESIIADVEKTEAEMRRLAAVLMDNLLSSLARP